MPNNPIVYDPENRLAYVILHQDQSFVIRAVIDPAMSIRIEKMSLTKIPSLNGSVEIDYPQIEDFTTGIEVALRVFVEITEGKFPGEET